jgi:ecotin
MRIFPLFLIFLSSAVTCISQQDTGSHHELKAFPSAEKGQVRYVWHPPKLANENDAKVELIAGKIIETDGVNFYSLNGVVETVPIKGWGYDRYVVNSDGGIIRTLMGIPPDTPRVNKFINIGKTSTLVRYTSRLPVVVYAPEGFIVKFRVWRPSDQLIEGQPG